MANTLNGFKVIGDTSMIGAGVKHGGAGQTSTAPSANGENRTLNGFKVVGDTSKIGAKAKETKAVTPSASPQPMGNASAGKNNKSSAQKKSFFEIATQNKAPGRVAENAQPRQTSYAGQLGQVSRNAAAPNSRYNAGNLRTAQKQEVAAPSIGKDRSGQYSLRKGLESVALKGGQQIAQAAGNTAAFAEDLLLAPFELFSGQELGAISDTAPFNTWAKGIQRNGQELQEKYAENIAKGGKAAELFDTYGSATVAAVPQAVLALMTSGASEAGTAAGLASTAAKELSPSVLNTVRSAVTEAAKDPQYWLSFGQVVGDGYEQALQDMQVSGRYDNNTARTKAALYAIGNGLLNAEVEVGGGIQTLPEELKHGAAAWKAWVDSMVDEGKEEVVQGVIERAMQNSVYYKGNPLASLSDENAILNPRTAAQEFAGGAIVGGILGGGQTFINSAINARNTPTATQEAPGAQADVREGTYTPSPANAAEGTQNAAPGVETAENIRVGQATTIKKPYKGEVPTQTQRQNTAPVQVSSEALTQAQNSIAGARGLESSFPVQSFKSTLKNAYKSIFKPAKGVVVEGATFNGQPYTVDIGNKVLGKVISDTKLTPEKLALLGNVSEVVQNGTYVGSGEYTQHSGKDRPTIRYDYFETPVSINGESYIAKFDVEVVPGANNYRTHQVVKMDLTPTEASLVGPEPTASSAASSPVEGTRPLNANDSIAQGEKNVKSDPLMDILFGKQGAEKVTDTPGDAAAGAVNTDFDRMQAKSDAFHPINENSARRVMNEQNIAPSEVPTVNPDTGNNITKMVSTILNSPLTSEEMKPIYESAIAGGKFDYTVQTDRGAVQQAQAKIARDGWQEVANSFIAKAELGQRITKADTAEAISAYNLAISEGDHKVAFELATAIADAAHDSAQMVQAMNLMNRLTPEGRLLTLRRLVDRMNDRAARQNRTPRQSTADSGDVEGARVDYIDKVTGFTLSDELATNYLMAETDAERAAAWDTITTSIADQIPSTFREKANFWRYTMMLTNPTTHIRNGMGNVIQFGARKIKNGIGAVIERAVIKDQSQRTKALRVDKDLKAFARSQYDTDQSAAMGSGKYSDATAAGIEREIQRKRKMFSGEDVLSRAVQGIGDLNSRALDYEDVIFNRAAYVDSFAQALKAKGVTAAEAHAGTRAADVEAARAYAIEEAQRATYRNTTALSEALSQFGSYEGNNPVKRAGSFVADALFPFRKTPANILTTGLDYSPVGLAKGIKEAMFDVKSGKCTAADAVDSIASGLTGTGILALGAYLAAEGFFGATLHVRAGDDDKEEAFEKSMGKQDYAIQIGDRSYTLDWAVPAAMPLFAGAAIMESIQKGGSTFDALVDSLLGMQDVVLETSMLSSLNDLISYWSYADNKVGYLIDRAVSSYAGQYIPTIGSKVASVFDDTARKSYVEKGKGQLSSDVNYFLQGAAKKVPGARNQLQPMVDMWGNEVSNGSAPERVFQSFISPGFLKAQDNSPATQEIRRLAKATGDSTVYPAAAEKSFMVNGEAKYLTGEEYTKYAKTMGSTRKQIVENMLKSKGYQKLSDDDKAKAISYAYEYAKVKGKQAVSNYKPSNSSFSKGALASVLPPDMYILYKVTADKDNNGSVTSVESAQALKNLTGLTDRQRGKAWEEKNSTTKPEKNPFTGALVEAGASVSTSISILDKYRELYNAEGMKPKEKAADFRAYVYGLGLTPAQIAAAQSTYTFFGSYPIEW